MMRRMSRTNSTPTMDRPAHTCMHACMHLYSPDHVKRITCFWFSNRSIGRQRVNTSDHMLACHPTISPIQCFSIEHEKFVPLRWKQLALSPPCMYDCVYSQKKKKTGMYVRQWKVGPVRGVRAACGTLCVTNRKAFVVAAGTRAPRRSDTWREASGRDTPYLLATMSGWANHVHPYRQPPKRQFEPNCMAGRARPGPTGGATSARAENSKRGQG